MGDPEKPRLGGSRTKFGDDLPLRAAAGDNVLRGLNPLTVPVSVLHSHIERETIKVARILSPEGRRGMHHSRLHIIGRLKFLSADDDARGVTPARTPMQSAFRSLPSRR